MTMVRFNPALKAEIMEYLDYTFIVEGKKDVTSLQALGFTKVYAIHQNSIPLRERVLQISAEIGRRERVCILTDLDKKGKQLYMLLKTLFQEQGMRLDSTLRGILLKAGISHIEGLSTFMERIDKIG